MFDTHISSDPTFPINFDKFKRYTLGAQVPKRNQGVVLLAELISSPTRTTDTQAMFDIDRKLFYFAKTNKQTNRRRIFVPSSFEGLAIESRS